MLSETAQCDGYQGTLCRGNTATDAISWLRQSDRGTTVADEIPRLLQLDLRTLTAPTRDAEMCNQKITATNRIVAMGFAYSTP